MQHRVLIVDDDYSVRVMLSRLFFFEGYEVTLAVDGQDALNQLEAGCPDLVLLDYNLPGDNGLIVLGNLKAHCPQVKIIVITGTDNPRVETQARDNGAEFFTKPLVLPELLSKARTLVA